MGAGLPKFVTVNLRELKAKFKEGEEVSLESLKEKNLLHVSGRESKLPLKVSSLFSLYSIKPIFCAYNLPLHVVAPAVESVNRETIYKLTCCTCARRR